MKGTHSSRHHAVVVAGGGFGGLCAALRAQEDGASVAVLEKAAETGGAAAWAVTIWCAADVDEWLKAQPGGDVELGGALVEQFHRGIGWLSEQGVSLRAVAEPKPHRFRRVIYQPVPDARSAMETLARRFRARGGRVFTDTELMGLIGGNGEPIAGVETSRGEIAASAVVLATGGFQGSATSGASRQNLRIDGLELAARVADLHLPVDAALPAVAVDGPRRHFPVQRRKVADAASVQALARHRTQFVLGDVQPAPVLRRVAELEATNQFPSPDRLEHFVERPLRVRVEVVADQGDLRALGVAAPPAGRRPPPPSPPSYAGRAPWPAANPPAAR